MKPFSIALWLVAAWGFASAIRDVFLAGVPRPEPFHRYLWFAIGSFLIPLIPLLLGLWLWKKANEVEGNGNSSSDANRSEGDDSTDRSTSA